MRDLSQEWVRGRRAAEMRRAIEEYERGGLSQAAFCRRQGIPLSTLTYWRRRLRGPSVGKPEPRLLEVEIVGEGVRSGALELRLPGGVTAVVTSDTNEELLRRLLRVVAQPC